jgi:flavin-dependent dehydrogenase
MYQVIIVGGGLAGLMNACLLAKAGVQCLVIEKKTYPFHKVCGEFISNEVRRFLISQELFPNQLAPPQINRLMISATNGSYKYLDLPLGGFGVSRFQLDYFWFQQASKLGVEFQLNTTVSRINFQSGVHTIKTSNHGTFHAKVVIGAYGKRSSLDQQLKRPFMGKRSAYLGVKYHYAGDWEEDLIALHSFNHGYCGISRVEGGKINLCYLSSRANLKQTGDIKQLEKQVLGRNPHLAKIFENFTPLFDKPLVINEISFQPKQSIVDHILMSGDTAGLITPLCGNGMAMAIHSAVLLAPRVVQFLTEKQYSRTQLELEYSRLWKQHFSRRLAAGRYLQQLYFLQPQLLIAAAKIPMVSRWLVRQTHGAEL